MGDTLDRLGWLRGWGVVPPSSPKALSGLGERGSGLSISATLPLGGGMPFGDTVAEANIAGLPPRLRGLVYSFYSEGTLVFYSGPILQCLQGFAMVFTVFYSIYRILQPILQHFTGHFTVP